MIERKNNLNLQYNNTAHSSKSSSTKSSKLPVFRSAVSNGQNTSVLKFLLIGIIALLFFSLAAAPVSALDLSYQGQTSLITGNIYHISTAAQLHNLSIKVNAIGDYGSGITFILDSDIDLGQNSEDTSNTTTTWTGGTSWTPIGTDSGYSFKGTFDGNNNTISDLYIYSTAGRQGLFGYIDGATVKNLGQINVNVTGGGNVGGLVGYIEHGTIENCYATGKVTSGGSSVGGLVGYTNNNDINIMNSYAAVTVTGSDASNIERVGGLVGRSNANIKNCYATGAVEGSNEVGGLVGQNYRTIENCYATGAVKGSGNMVGGLVGFNDYDSGGRITNSVALNPSVSGSSNVGRVVGLNSGITGATITNCYAWDGISGTWTNDENGKDGADASSVDVWANLTFYQHSDKLNWGNNITISGTTVWNINTSSIPALDWRVPYLRSFGEPTGDQLISSIQHLRPLTVTYDGNGNTSGIVPVDLNGYTYNKSAIVLENTGNLQRTGHTFVCWNSMGTGDGIDYNSGDSFNVTDDTIIYAKWIANITNITLDPNGGTIGTSKINISYGEAVYEPDPIVLPTKSGFEFNGWYNESNGGVEIINSNGNIMLDRDGYTDSSSWINDTREITLYAKWTPAVTPTSNPVRPSGGSTDTGSGNYKEYDRSVTDGGAVSFGTSPIVTEVDLPKGTTGQVALIAESDVPAPEGKKTVTVFEINVPNYPSGEESVVKFKLTLTEIEKAGYTPSDICLYHCDENGVWTKLPTTYTIKDGVVYYEAVTTAFSPFAIVYEENGAAEVSQPTVTPVKTQTAEPVSTYVEPTKTAVPTPEQTKSPLGLVGLGLGLLGAALVLRRK